MKNIIRFLSVIALVFASPALAQTGTQFPAGNIYGNPTASKAPGQPASPSAIIDRSISSTQGAMLYRNSTIWTALTPGTVGLPLLSGGAAANLSYGILGLSAGGLGGSQSAATANQVPVYPGTGGAAVPTTITPAIIGSLFANPNCTVGLTAVNGVATTAERTDSSCPLSQSISPTMTGNWTFNPASGNALTITTLTGSTAKVFNTSQSGATGTGIASYVYNNFAITDSSNITGAGGGVAGWKYTITTGSTNSVGFVWGQWIELTYNSASTQNGDHIASVTRCVMSVTNSGAGGCYGSNPQAILLSGAHLDLTSGELSGTECDSRIDIGASAQWHFGCAAVSTGTARGTTLDSAFEVGSVSSGGNWLGALLLNNGHGAPALATTATIIGSDGATETISCVICLSTYTATTIFDFGSPLTVTGAGSLKAAKVMAGPIVTNNVLLTANANTVAGPTVDANTIGQIVSADGVTNFIAYDTFGGAANKYGNIIFRTARGTAASFTATQSGDLLGFFGGVGANAANTFGPMAGSKGGAFFGIAASETWGATAGGTEIQFYTTPNTTQVVAIAGKFRASGGLTIGNVATDPGIGGLYVNAQYFMPNITTSSAAQTGTVCWTTGTGKFTADTTVGCLTSLAKAKNIDSELSPRYALNIIERLQPISFHYKKGWGDSGHYAQFGFTADQAATIDERLVGRDPDGNLQGFRYQEYGAVLTAAMQELKADNDNMRQRIVTLEKRKAAR